MNHESQAPSGNRWEPTDRPELPLPPEPFVAWNDAAPVRRRWVSRARTVVAGAAAAVLLAGGLGVAVGRSIAGSDEHGGADQQQGVPAGFDRDADGPGPGGPGLGQVPPSHEDRGNHQDGAGDDGTGGSNT